MSAFVPPVAPITPESSGVVIIEPISQRVGTGEPAAAPVGTGQKAVITNPNASGGNPAVINVTDNASAGFVEVAAGTLGVDVAIVGSPSAENAARIEIGLAASSTGAIQSNAGSTVQVADYYKGDVIVNYNGAIPVPGAKVNLDTQTVGNSTADSRDTSSGTIFTNGPSVLLFPGSTYEPDFYIQTGSGSDEIQGSAANDFIRAGAGDDIVNGGDGNDIIRAGTGSDVVTLGPGADVYYLTFDQFLTPDGTAASTRDVLTDFDNFEDKVQLSAQLQDQVTITGLGTSELTITYNNSDPVSTLVLVSQNGIPFSTDTVQFV